MIAIADLPAMARPAAERLVEGARAICGDDLVALWLSGSTTFEGAAEEVARDIDAHVVVRALDDEAARRLRGLVAEIELDAPPEVDAWVISAEQASGGGAPTHLLDPAKRDGSWALHRAHLLAGRCVTAHGSVPATILASPTWAELYEALRSECADLERSVAAPPDPAYLIRNACRIVFSVEQREVVVSKRDAAAWARAALPEHRDAIDAAARAYRDAPEPGDDALMRPAVRPLVALARTRVTEARA